MSERAGRPVKVVFVCWGNICRSPIAERVARRWAEEAGLTGVEFTSAATSSEEIGAPMDRRARLTDDGRRVLDGAADAVAMDGIDRWICGVHLHGRTVPWRWDPQAGRIVAG